MRGLAFAALFLAVATSASAQPALTQPLSGTYATLGDVRLRLPAGDWQPVQESETQAYFDGGGLSNNNLLHRLYLQMEGGRLAATLLISTERVEAGYGWQPPRMCTRSDTYWADQRNNASLNFDCALVNHVVMRETPRTKGLAKAAFDAARMSGGMPKQVVRASIAEGRSKRHIAVVMSFNPELTGLPPSGANWKDSEWQKTRADAAHAAYLDRVVAWTQAYRTAVRDALP